MTTRIRTPITGHTSDDPEAEAEAAMFAAWKKLQPAQRPRMPQALADLMITNFVAPQADFAPSASERFQLQVDADRYLASLVRIARAYRREVPTAKHMHVLASLMAERLLEGNEDSAGVAKLVEVEAAIQTLANAPRLLPRPDRVRPSSVQDPLTRVMVNAVYWYVDRFDRAAPARMLARVTISALGYNPRSFERHIEEVRSNGEWRNPDFGWYDSWSLIAPSKLAA